MILEEKLKKHFGYSSFRAQQQEIISNVLDGVDTIVLMPTGGGKSICYQLPALLLPGITIVVSPLIALMEDQVQALRANGIAAAYLISSLQQNEEEELTKQLRNNQVKLLYVSPERIMSNGFISFMRSLDISLFAIDEAHCVSSWGHQFRPDYASLSILKQEFAAVPMIALTATADKTVRKEIGELLQLNNASYFISSFDRPNLSLSVLPGQKKWEQLQKIVARNKDSFGIIYCLSRKNTEELAQKLRDAGFAAQAYHAGIEMNERSRVQNDFINGQLKIVVATIAFGMGIDKSNVRFVVHYNLPGNLESYYQEIGRAGRDGLPAEAVLFYSYRDVQLRLSFLDNIESEQYKEIQDAKLQRMKEYAESQVCRRKILLTYFSDTVKDNCGNCDVCENPPTYFDGTKLAQMAMSAMKRCNEEIGVNALIDVVKGSLSPAVRQKNLQQIKTFGAGREQTQFAWQMFVQQFIQLGLIEIDYKHNYHLKLTNFGTDVLYGKYSVDLIRPETIQARQKANKEKVAKIERKKQKQVFPTDDELYEVLRALRKEIADKKRQPAYRIFSNASLENMSALKPTTLEDFLEVHGVGVFKAKQYAIVFIAKIQEYLNN